MTDAGWIASMNLGFYCSMLLMSLWRLLTAMLESCADSVVSSRLRHVDTAEEYLLIYIPQTDSQNIGS